MANYTQANRQMSITSPLGKDDLLLVGFQGHEAISELFHFQLDLRAPKEKPVAFDKIVGQPVTVKLALPGGGTRFFNGIVKRFTQRGRDEVFTQFRAEVVPQLWLLTKKVQSRIFQHVSIPDILKQVLTGLKVKYEIQGTYHPRDFCVQYRESDFAFVSRLMEEEGIYYFFTHADGSHEMIVTDVPNKHPDVPGQSKVIYDEAREGQRDELRIHEWEKTQELRSGQYTLWDHCFELPGKNFEAKQTILDSVAVGKVSHKLKVGGNDKLEIYDYPGAYAQRFDGVDKGGGPQPADLQKIFEDNKRTVKIRMEQEALPSLEIQGASNCGHFVPGHQFDLTRHFDADGPYVLTRVEHSAQLGGNYRSGEDVHLEYQDRFTCIPAGLPYRPPLLTPEPTVLGTQTATVVGPPGEKIFCDKYGRVKVQFHWDRQGKKDAGSSCWLRVAQMWASGGFGAIAIPRIGDEVVVDFLEGDPDQPIIVGCVYNAAKMPPFILPEHRMFSGIKSNSVDGQPSKNFSGLALNDATGSERVALYSEKDMMVNAEHDHKHHVGHYKHTQIGSLSLTSVGGIPGGGGSGGGGGPETSATTDDQGKTTDPSYGNWKTSNGLLSAQPGMAGSVIYGVNSQDTVGWMHQVTIGAAYQICCNPIGYFGFIPNPLDGLGAGVFGALAGIGGNVQMYFGANVQAVYGPAITINHGPAITITAKPWTATCWLAPVVPGLSLLYELAFGGMYSRDKNETGRDDLYRSSVAAIALATTCLLTSEAADRAKQMGEKAVAVNTADTLLKTCLGIAGSKNLPDFMKKMIPDAKLNAQAMKPDDPLAILDDAHSVNVVEGVSLQTAKHIHVLATKDPAAVPPDPTPSTVYINAVGKGNDGVAFINATKGMTLSSGAAMVELEAKDPTSGDVTLHCGVQGNITVRRTLEDAKPQMIQMAPSGILIDGGVAPKPGPIQLQVAGGPPTGSSVTLDPTKGITLQCGQNKITIDQKGVTIDALQVTVQAKLKHETKAMLAKKQFTLGDLQITLAKHQ